MFEPQVFPEQMYCIEESTCDVAGTFRCPPGIRRGARDIIPPFPHQYVPGSINTILLGAPRLYVEQKIEIH